MSRRDRWQDDPEALQVMRQVSPGWGRHYAALWHGFMRLPLVLRWMLVPLVLVAGTWANRKPAEPPAPVPMPTRSDTPASVPAPAPVREPAGDVVGVASVVDGDTLDIHGQRVRLWGIDAPESSQTCTVAGKVARCGQAAALALADYLGQRAVSCTRKDTDRYGRMVGVCSVSGVEVNRWQVEQGNALAYVQYGGAVYNEAEARARAARLGVWAGSFVEPWNYRKAKREGTSSSSASTSSQNGAASSRAGMFTSCKEARAAGKTPLLRGEPGYNPKLDGDKDGKACE